MNRRELLSQGAGAVGALLLPASLLAAPSRPRRGGTVTDRAPERELIPWRDVQRSLVLSPNGPAPWYQVILDGADWAGRWQNAGIGFRPGNTLEIWLKPADPRAMAVTPVRIANLDLDLFVPDRQPDTAGVFCAADTELTQEEAGRATLFCYRRPEPTVPAGLTWTPAAEDRMSRLMFARWGIHLRENGIAVLRRA